MRPVKGIYIDTFEIMVDDDCRLLSLWKNPDTGALTALDTMNLPLPDRFFYDAYTGQKVIVEDTFSGLPK